MEMEEGRMGEGRERERRREKKVHKRSLCMELQIEYTHTRMQIPIIPFILPASSYCAWGCGDLADRAENRPPFPHLPESSEEQTQQEN